MEVTMKEKKIVKINLTDLEKEKLAQKEMLSISGIGDDPSCDCNRTGAGKFDGTENNTGG